MRRSQGTFFLLFLFALLLSSAASAAPRLVKDLYQGPPTEEFPAGTIGVMSFRNRTVADRGILYFSAPDPAHGTELWRSDGTPAGTYRLTDVCAGRCSSLPQDLHIFQGRVYFSADDGFTGREVWSSAGTPGSERRLRDLCPGPCSFDPSDLQSAGGILFFLDHQGETQRLWRSDGTRLGTAAVATFCTERPFGAGCAMSLQRLGNRLLFVVNGAVGSELWSSDGTPGGTVLLSLLTAGGQPRLEGGAVVNGGNGGNGSLALFFTDDGVWRTDGTPGGTAKLKDFAALTPEAGTPSYGIAAVWKGAFYLFFNYSVVRSNGTPQGTVRLNTPPLFAQLFLAPLRDRLLFYASRAEDGLGGIWALDGAGHVAPAFLPDSAHPASIGGPVALGGSQGNRAVFQVQSAANLVPQLWVTDGTPAGTSLIRSGGSVAFQLIPAGGYALYVVGSYQRAAALWRTDGTKAGTFRVRDFAAGPGSSGPLEQAALGGKLVFSARTGTATAPLFRTDGSAAGTVPLSNQAAFAQGFARVGSRLFFAARPGRLWRTDGTAAGTAPIASGINGYAPLAVLGQRLLFSNGDNSSLPSIATNQELWSSDGAATGRVKEINPFLVSTELHGGCTAESSSPGSGAVLANGLFVFPADDGLNGRELWASDGSDGGTRLIADINPQRSPFPPPINCDGRTSTGLPSNPAGFVAFQQGALFAADDGASGRELWRTDGSGAQLVRDLRPGAQGSEPHDLTVFQGAVYFIAAAPQGLGEVLWRTDGTAAGTAVVDDLRVAALPSWGRSLTVAGSQLFFVVTNEATGPELWVSRGEATSTGMVADLSPGTAGSSPQELTAVGNAVVFAATDGKRGLEPWRSNGTAAGTVRLGDLNPGRDASSPGPFTRAGNFIFTGAYDPVHGRELWAIPVAEVTP